ncbi:MAG: isoleucyl-tRNA synthetase [Solirubrobacteraceae bacterium]|jgi:isoleucyl-tRNA synthetase|nr:isoleucyl-tRNA synthetase [Solirubrobacteraceae bacterium]
MAYRTVDPQQSFPDLEHEVLERWRAREVFPESLRRREGAEPWVFYEGPPTANGRPGVHHVLARVFKDIYPRYKTMRGYRVERKGGWDCHGLPVEIAVEQQLGLKSKEEIEAYGIAAFNRRCRESVFEYLSDWNRLTERIGFWIDLEDAYRTLDDSYIESVWWALEQIHAKGLLYEGHKVVPYCPRCGTALSSHEVALGYRDVEDPSLYVRMPVAGAHGPLQAGDELLIWTTTPWTLVANAAIAADPELAYVRARLDGTTYVLAESLRERVLGDGAEVLARFPGRELDGAAYLPPFDYIPAAAWGERGHTVLMADFVSDTDGTGLVHTAIAFGEDDFRLGAAYGLNVVNPVRLDGTYDDSIGPYAGRFVKDADGDLTEDLRRAGRLLRAELREHSYPHCWRCGTPLLYYAKPSWYIATTRVRDRLLAANDSVDWHPSHIQHGRFGDWLENNVDWALSRERYWGTPLPIWRCPSGHHVCIGSFAELERRSGTPVGDPHRPYVDDLSFPCEDCGEAMRRVPEVIDVWFDSGAMPFAQHHAPFEHEDRFEQAFPADFICEALDQTRGWFYSLLAVSTLLHDRAPYRNVVCLGLILDSEGQKMSKSRGNIVAPDEILDRFGADALRWYFFTAKAPWDGYRFSTEAVGDAGQLLVRQLWNTYYFYVLFANATGTVLAAETAAAEATDLDRWILSRLAATVAETVERLDAYDATQAGRGIGAFVDELSNWYVRRSRRRFWDGDPTAFATLQECLVTVARLLAPFTPFLADEIYDNLDGGEPSVHLEDFPRPGARDLELEFAMATARETVRLGRAARAQAKVRTRQPLREAIVVASSREREAIERLAELVREELNVKRLRFVAAADELGRHQVKANYRSLGPRFGKSMPRVAAAIAGVDPAHVASTLAAGGRVAISVDGHDHELGAEDLILTLAPLEGYGLEREGSHAVALELALDEDLVREGLAREIVHAVQAARKAAGLDVEDRISLALGGDADLLAAARVHDDYIAGETLATALSIDGDGGGSESVIVDGRELVISVARA